MDPYDLSIRLKTLDGAWEEVGAEAIRYRGVWPENVQYTHNDWGDDTCSFDLRRDPGAIHPDLSAFTDCEITVCGRLAWSGRVKETPTREGADPVINVQGEGWQYHLDDDQYERAYVHTRLSEYQDIRGVLTASLAAHRAYGQVETSGGVTLMAPSATAILTNDCVGVVVDLGSGPGAKRAVLDVETSNNSGGHLVVVIGSDTPYWGDAAANRQDYVPGGALTTIGASGQLRGNTSLGHRYVTILLFYSGAAATLAADVWVRITAAHLFGEVAYEGLDVSVLKADTIVRDALDRATLLLDPDRTGIQAGTFSIPEFATSQLVSPREVWNAANAYENYETKIDARRPIFRPRASAPIYEIGEWSGAEFEDASANSGAEILNRVFVEGQTAGGERLVVARTSAEQTGALLEVVASPAPTNPSFATNTTGWSVTGTSAAITRDTVIFDTSPASGKWACPIGGAYTLTGTFTGSFVAGTTYVLDFRLRGDGPGSAVEAYFGDAPTGDPAVFSPGFGAFNSARIVWAPQQTTTSVTLVVSVNLGSPENFWIDSLALQRAIPTLIDRRGFRKSRTLPISNRITQASGERLGDLYLDQHKSTPFAGGFKAVGVGGVRRVLGGQAVHPGWLGRDTGQLVRANHVIDPDTGGVGRDERIKTVAYDHNTLTATVSLAEDRGGFDALLAQLAVVVGS